MYLSGSGSRAEAGSGLSELCAQPCHGSVLRSTSRCWFSISTIVTPVQELALAKSLHSL